MYLLAGVDPSHLCLDLPELVDRIGLWLADQASQRRGTMADQASHRERCQGCREQAHVDEGELDQRLADVELARERILLDAGRVVKGEVSEGVIPCPVCKAGTLKYLREPRRGRIHATCSTPSCVASLVDLDLGME